jgi:hypothetical protein
VGTITEFVYFINQGYSHNTRNKYFYLSITDSVIQARDRYQRALKGEGGNLFLSSFQVINSFLERAESRKQVELLESLSGQGKERKNLAGRNLTDSIKTGS